MNTTFMEPVSGSGHKNATPLIRVVERGDELTARLLVSELGADPNYIITVSRFIFVIGFI
jgi:hypothetical protein